MATTRARKKPVPVESESSDPWEDGTLPLNLKPELSVVRQVLRRLVKLWDAQGESIDTEEARRLATLIFNGARTAAILLYQHNRGAKKDEMPDWLDAALDAFAERNDLDL